jgi:glycosyltransferase involved in cell wall biosynthesis
MINGLVSIGLPVFNGENFLEKTLKCIISQSYENIEVLISDNNSADKTREICCDYASKDKRIVYSKNENNLGASCNYNVVFKRSRGEYFKWAAHDDLFSINFVEECVKVLSSETACPLCHSKVLEIDENERIIKRYPSCERFSNKDAVRRFFECICKPHSQSAVFGVFRTSVLSNTRLIGNYSSSDRTLLGEVALRGPIIEIPKYLFFKRSHPTQHYKIYTTKHSRNLWYDPRNNSRLVFPHWRLLREHLLSISRVNFEIYRKILCYLISIWWMRKNYRGLIANLFLS